MVPRIGLSPDREAGLLLIPVRPDQLPGGGLAVQRLRYRAVRQRQARDAVPPIVRKLDQIVVDAQILPALALCFEHGIERGVIDHITFAVLGQTLAEAVRRKRLHQFGMADIAVIALAVVFHHELPVGRLDQIILHCDLELAHVVEADLRLDIGLHAVDRRRVIGQAQEDQPADVLQRNGAQAVVRLVEFLRHVACGQQLAIEGKGPLVVGTGDPRRFASAFTQLRTAVSAAVVEGLDVAILGPHHDDRRIAQLEQEPVARVLHVRHGAGIEPHRLEHDLGVEAVGLFAHIEVLRQCEPRAGLLEALGNRVKVHHGISSAMRCCPGRTGNPGSPPRGGFHPG